MVSIPRPAYAIQSWQELKTNDEVWEVYGIWPPFIDGPKRISRAPKPYKTHPQYSSINKSSANLIVFDLNSQLNFASDHNLEGSHNNNYLFRSEADAWRYRDEAHAAWRADPDEISRVIAERYIERQMDDYDCYEY